MNFYNLKKFSLILLFLLLAISSCSEFEDGPKYSLRSTKARISKVWKIEWVTDLSDGTRRTSGYEGWTLSIEKSGKYFSKTVYLGEEKTTEGTWEFTGDTGINFIYERAGEQIIETHTILRLANKEFWIINDIEEVHYIPN